MSKTNIRKGDKPYFDDANFPRGFNRSGEFTITESLILNDYGNTFKRLFDGSLMPENDEEKQFVKVVNRELAPNSQYEKTWMKYIELVAPKKFYSLNGRHKPIPDTDSSEYSLEL